MGILWHLQAPQVLAVELRLDPMTPRWKTPKDRKTSVYAGRLTSHITPPWVYLQDMDRWLMVEQVNCFSHLWSSSNSFINPSIVPAQCSWHLQSPRSNHPVVSIQVSKWTVSVLTMQNHTSAVNAALELHKWRQFCDEGPRKQTIKHKTSTSWLPDRFPKNGDQTR